MVNIERPVVNTMPASDANALPVAATTAAIALLYAALAVLAFAQGEMASETIAASIILGGGLALASAIDLRSFRLPDAITLTLAVTGLVLTGLLHWEPSLWWRALAVIGGYGFVRAIDLAYLSLRGRMGIGQGDAKLFAATGAWLGPEGLPTAMLYACATALLFVAARHLTGTPMTAKQRIAFGPFIAGGTWLVWLWGPITT